MDRLLLSLGWDQYTLDLVERDRGPKKLFQKGKTKSLFKKQ
jgi:hypothetical protein